MNFSIFITTLYGWVIKPLYEQVPMIAFALLMVAIIVPIGIFIGHTHFKKQYPIESTISLKYNPFTYKIYKKSKEILLINSQITILQLVKNSAKIKAERDNCDKSIDELKKLLEGIDSRDIL